MMGHCAACGSWLITIKGELVCPKCSKENEEKNDVK